MTPADAQPLRETPLPGSSLGSSTGSSTDSSLGSSIITARVRDAGLRLPFYIDGSADLVSVCRELSQRGLTQALVRDVRDGVQRVGIFTTADLRDALLRPQSPQQLAVREVAHFELVGIDADADLFEALWLMVRHRVHRLVVRDGAAGGAAGDAAIIGVLGQLELLSLVARHPHIAALQIDDAATLADLRAAALHIDELVRVLHGSGVHIPRITRLVSELNTRLIARLWALLAPPEVVANSCLLVMGSEGRGEQILKTDQDNALLLRDGFSHPVLETLATEVSVALTALGYPRCPGDIMLSNPLWRQPIGTFRETLRDWVYGASSSGTQTGADEGPMHLAIFFDAACVAGDAALLVQARAHLDRILSGQDQFLARFAAAADQFQEPGNWFTRLTGKRDDQPLDLKKLGVFPIVHGVRALALQHGVREQGTAARLAQLVALGKLDPTLARDCVDALHLLMGVRLTHQLRQRADGLPASNRVLS